MTQLHRHAPAPGTVSLQALLASLEADPGPLPPFSPEAMAFFAVLSERLIRHPEARRHPDVLALAYWLRPSELSRLKARFEAETPAGTVRVPRGLAFHVPPANVDTMFVYSWVLSSLVGNRNVIRLSPRTRSPGITLLLEAVNALLAEDDHAAIAQRTLVVGYGHDADANRALSAACDMRVLWGGDAAVGALRTFPLPAHAHELTFPDRFSMAAFDTEAYMAAAATERDALARAFYNDAYWFDQRGCASPRLLLWCGDPALGASASRDFYRHLEAALAARAYVPEPALAIGKQLAACRAILDLPVSRMDTYGSALTVLTLSEFADVRDVHPGGGLFFQTFPASLQDLAPHLARRDQTLTHFGFSPDALLALVTAGRGRGLDRLMPIGQALDFEAVWDGHDLLQAMSRTVRVQPAAPRRCTMSFGQPDVEPQTNDR